MAEYQNAKVCLELEKIEEAVNANPEDIFLTGYVDDEDFRVSDEDLAYLLKDNEYFSRFLGDTCPFYVKREFSPANEVLDAIHSAGGIAVLAHPLQYRYPSEKLRSMIEFFCSYGLDAMETKYSAYDREEEMYLRSLALRYGLKRSGGSDYHGSIKPGLSLGTGYGNGWHVEADDVTVL